MMSRRNKIWVLVAVVMLGGAATQKPASPAEPLPVPPIPPTDAPSFGLAPVPDPNFIPPLLSNPGGGARFAPKLFVDKSFDPSQGFLPGSRIDSEPERQHLPTPGFNVLVPLQ